MIRRDVFDQLADAGFAPEIRMGAGIYEDPTRKLVELRDFYQHGTNAHGCFFSEDAAFCARWRHIGGRIWLDPAIKLKHHGDFAYEGDPMSMFREAPIEAAA
jgi:hypothetical protein